MTCPCVPAVPTSPSSYHNAAMSNVSSPRPTILPIKIKMLVVNLAVIAPTPLSKVPAGIDSTQHVYAGSLEPMPESSIGSDKVRSWLVVTHSTSPIISRALMLILCCLSHFKSQNFRPGSVTTRLVYPSGNTRMVCHIFIGNYHLWHLCSDLVMSWPVSSR